MAIGILHEKYVIWLYVKDIRAMLILLLTWIRLYPFDVVETCVAMRILCEKQSTWLYAKDFYAREIPTLTSFFFILEYVG